MSRTNWPGSCTPELLVTSLVEGHMLGLPCRSTNCTCTCTNVCSSCSLQGGIPVFLHYCRSAPPAPLLLQHLLLPAAGSAKLPGCQKAVASDSETSLDPSVAVAWPSELGFVRLEILLLSCHCPPWWQASLALGDKPL